MSINFPNSPSNGDTYTFNNTQYTWDGEKWDSSLSAIISNTFPGITVTGVSTISGDIDVADSKKINLGSSDDLQIYHDTSNSYIDNTTGSLFIRGANGNHVKIQSPSGEDSVVAAANGSVELYYDNAKKLETVNAGVTVTGTLAATALSGDGSNLTGVDYDDLSNKPTIPTNNNQLTNGAGFITTSFTNTNQLTNGAGFITDTVTGDFSVTGAVSVGGTLTYEDVTNVDSVGLITARSGIHVTSGNVGIGTDSPNFSGFGGNTGGIEISNVNTNNALLVQSGTNEFYFANTSTVNYIWGDDNVPLSIATNDTERLRIDNVGSAQFTGGDSPSGLNTRISRYGSLLVATTGELLSNARCSIDSGNGNITTIGNLIVASGKGIDFSATADGSGTTTSEVLDDYEEGTWTPTYLAASGNITSSINQGVYVKIGNAVNFSFRLGSTMTNFSGVSGQVKVAGLPFTVGSSTQQRVGGGSIDELYRWSTNFANFRGYPEAGTTAIAISIMNPNDSAYVNLNVTDMSSGTNQNIMTISGWYTTTNF